MDAIATGEVTSDAPRRGRQQMLAAMLMLFVSLPVHANLRAAEPAPSAGDQPAAQGKLVICGGGALPLQLRSRFIELAGGPQARVVVITTASSYADSEQIERKLKFWREQRLASLTILHTRSRETADNPEFARPLHDATGVWFVGGNQNCLTETYLGTVTEREIRGVLSRSGVVGGTSAGAAIMSPVMIRRGDPDVETGPGFGFLPGTVVDQHFLKRNRQRRLLKALGAHPNLVGLGIDEGTALVVDGNHVSVVGESQVVVCSPATDDNPESVQSLEPGTETDLTALRTLVAHVVMKPAATLADSATQPAEAPKSAPTPLASATSVEPEKPIELGQ